MTDKNSTNEQEQPGEALLQDEGSSVGLVETKYVRLFTGENKLKLMSGQTFGPIDIAYETYGELNEARDNAILLIHALSGDAHVAGKHKPDDRKSGWWDIMIGPGKPIDTNKYFIVCSNCLGGCMGTTGPGSVNPDTGKPYGLSFPVITISDMVELQRHLIDYLGIDKLLAVIGGSMGGMVTLDWSIRYPDRTHAIIPIATTSRLTAQGIAFNAVGRNAILTDNNFNEGNYYNTDHYPNTGLAVARMIGHITYLSEEAMHEKFGRRLQNAQNYKYDLVQEFSVESYLDYQGMTFVDRFDANTYVYFTKAMDYFDLSMQFGGSLEEALAKIQTRFLLVSFNTDWLFPPSQTVEIVNALIRDGKDVTYCDIDCPFGHDSFLLETKVQGSLLKNFLRNTQEIVRQSTIDMADTSAMDIKKNQPLRRAKGSIFKGNRVDHRQIAKLIEPDSSVLDLGCGDGQLLALLQDEKNIRGMGITLSQDDVQACVQNGVSVVQYDIAQCLDKFNDDSYDYVVLSQALQIIRQPEKILRQLLRIGKRVIVSFPNFAYWQGRLQMLLKGKAPVWKSLPHSWYDKPEESVNYMSIADFEDFVNNHLKASLIERIPFNSQTGRQTKFCPNFFADEVIFVISDKD